MGVTHNNPDSARKKAQYQSIHEIWLAGICVILAKEIMNNPNHSRLAFIIVLQLVRGTR